MKNRIRQLRKNKDLKQEDLMPVLNIGRSQVSKLETGNASLTDEAIVKLCDFFKVPADYLLYHDVDYDLPAPELLTELEKKILLRFHRISRTNQEIVLKILQIDESMLDDTTQESSQDRKKEANPHLLPPRSKHASGE